MPGPDPAAVRCPHEDITVCVRNEDLVAVVTPFEVTDWGAPVVDEFHHRAAVVVSPDDDSA